MYNCTIFLHFLLFHCTVAMLRKSCNVFLRLNISPTEHLGLRLWMMCFRRFLIFDMAKMLTEDVACSMYR
uniref:Secreted protein n=1 Tax=Setaria viridis TaxID=4556 RepID=A0A4V6D749_SETVI|nr:hypothetical protein SEVIR_7G054209v2 [Setaria viridis]